MFLPQKLVPTEVLCRFPVPAEIKKILSKEDAVLLLSAEAVRSVLQATRDYYRNILVEANGTKQRKAPLLAEVFMTSEECEETQKRGYKTGDYVFIKNFSLVDVGVDDEKDFYYFLIAPGNLGSVYSKEDGDIIFKLYRNDEIFEVDEIQEAKQDMVAESMNSGVGVSAFKAPAEAKFNHNGLGYNG